MRFNPMDILLVFIVLCGVVLLTFTYLQDRPPHLIVLNEAGEGVVVDVYGKNKCSLHITGDVKNEGDIKAIDGSITCSTTGSENAVFGIGSANVGEVMPHKTKEFAIDAFFSACPEYDVDFSCKTSCENCPD
jgi:hypothetical protein